MLRVGVHATYGTAYATCTIHGYTHIKVSPSGGACGASVDILEHVMSKRRSEDQNLSVPGGHVCHSVTVMDTKDLFLALWWL